MIIGINATAAVKKQRTGVEEHSYQLIKALTELPEAKEHRFFLYVPQGGFFDFLLPKNFEIKELNWPLPFFWTQARLAWEVWRRSPDILFIPCHILPVFAPKNSVVVIHGLEYEFLPQYYSFFRRLYLCFATKNALRRARKIISVSEFTKSELVKLYGAEAEKIAVAHHGIDFRFQISDFRKKNEAKNRYLLYIGRVETKKNISGILDAFKILKEKYKIPHKLILAGKPGFGYNELKLQIKALGEDVIEKGFVSEEEKWELLADADIFLFPSFCEGFGIPVLEAQISGVPIVTAFNSCLPEVAGQGALFVNLKNPEQIAEAVQNIISDKTLREKLIEVGFKNVGKFSWEKCARETLVVILE